MSGSLAVIGGGVIGCRWRAGRTGRWSVQLHRTGDRGASWSPRHAGPTQRRLARRRAVAAAGSGVAAAVARGRFSGRTAAGWLPPASRWWWPSTRPMSRPADVADWLSTQGHPVIWESAARDVEPCWHKDTARLSGANRTGSGQRAVLDALSLDCERRGVRWAPPINALSDVEGDMV